MKEKFMIVQNFYDAANWDGFGTHKATCWDLIKNDYDSAAEAVADKNKMDIPEYTIVIKYYE